MLKPFVVAFAVGGFAPADAAQPSGVEPNQVREWFEREWCRGLECLPSGRAHVRVRFEWFEQLTDADLRELERDIQDKPDHPKRPMLESERAKRERGPQVQEFDFWIDGDRWRFSESWWRPGESGEPFGFVDYVMTPSVFWSLSLDALHVADPRQMPSSNAEWFRKPDTPIDLVAEAFDALAHGGIGGNNTPSVVGVTPLEREGMWRVTTMLREGFRTTYDIEFDGVRGTGRVRTRRAHRMQDGRLEPMAEWALSPDSVATPFGELYREQTRFDLPGRVVRKRISLLLAEALDGAKFETLLVVPDARGSDPIRGEVTFTSIYDYRPGHGRLTRLATDTLPGASRVLRGAPTSGPSIRLIGWIVAGCLTSAIVVIRVLAVRRRRAGSLSHG